MSDTTRKNELTNETVSDDKAPKKHPAQDAASRDAELLDEPLQGDLPTDGSTPDASTPEGASPEPASDEPSDDVPFDGRPIVDETADDSELDHAAPMGAPVEEASTEASLEAPIEPLTETSPSASLVDPPIVKPSIAAPLAVDSAPIHPLSNRALPGQDRPVDEVGDGTSVEPKVKIPGPTELALDDDEADEQVSDAELAKYVRNRIAPPEPGVKKPRRWRRRIGVTLVVLLLLACAFRAALPFLLPALINKVAGMYKLDCSYERLEMSLLGGDVGLWHLKLTPQSGGDPILETDYVRGNISPLALLAGRLDVWRAEVDGVDVSVDREADGSIQLLRQLLDSVPQSSAPAAAPKTTGVGASISLKPPLTLDALRVLRVRVRLRDKTLNPPLVSELLVNVRVSDVGSLVRPTRFEVDASFDPIFDTIRIDGEGRTDGKELNANVKVWARGVRLREAAPYLATLGIRPVANEISAKMAGTLKATLLASSTGQPNVGDAVAVNLSLDGAALAVDGKEAAAADKVSVDIKKLTFDEAAVAKLEIAGVRAAARRAPNGHLLVAGAEIVPMPAAPATAPAVAANSQPARGGGPINFRASIDELLVKDVRADFVDEAVAPAAKLAFVVNAFTVKDLELDAGKPYTTANFSANLGLPGVVKSVVVTGSAKPFAATKTLAITAKAEGIRPDALKPYLDPLHVESTFENGTLAGDVNASLSLEGGTIKAGVTVGKVSLVDRGELLTFDGMKVVGAVVDPAKNLVHVDSIEVAGPSVPARRNADGGVSAMGLRLRLPSTLPVAAVAQATPDADGKSAVAVAAAGSKSPVQLPTIEIGKFTWKGIKANLEDATVSPPTSASLADAGVEVDKLRLTFDPADKSPSTGTIRAWLSVPGSAEKLTADGAVSSTAQGATIDLSVAGSGLQSDLLKPYLEPFGVEPILKNGSLAAKAKLTLAQSNYAITTSLGLNDVSFKSDGEELLGLDALKVDGVSLRADEVSVDLVQVDRPRAAVTRDADGSFLAAGLRVRPSTQPVAKVEEPLAIPAKPGATEAKAPAAPTTTAPTAFAAILKKLVVTDGAIAWTDRAMQPNVSTTASASVDLDHLVIGRQNGPATLRVVAKVKDSVDGFTLAGTVSTAPDAPSVKLDLKGTGLRAGALAAYLPPGITVTLKDGQFATNFEAAIGKNPQGGQTAKLLVSGLTYADGAQSLFKLDAVRLIASQIELPDKALALDEIVATGIETDARKTADGAIEALGVSIKAPPPQSAEARTEPPAELASLQLTPTTSPAPQKPVNVADVAAAMVASKNRPLPLVTLDKLDLGVKRFTFTDLSRPDASPVTLADLTVTNPSRVEMLGTDAGSRPTVKILVAGKIDPLVGSLKVDLQTSPFAPQPNLVADVALAGIRGEGLTAILPELKKQIDGSGMTDGTFGAHLEATTKFDRRTPIDFDLSRGFELSFLAKDIAFRSQPDGPILAGLESIESEGIRVKPTTGAVHAKLIEVVKPMGVVVREPDGIHALGWVVKLPRKADEATTQPSTFAVEPEPSQQNAPLQPVARRKKPEGEIRIDRLTVSGLDVRVEDRSVAPPTVVPLTDLDLEVKGLSNWAMYEEKPIRFSAVVSAGKVDLPKVEQGGGGGIIGLFGALDKLDQKAPTTRQYEKRDLLSQVLASGEVTLYPTPKGWFKSSVTGFELSSVEGTAKDVGVTVGGGVFDSDIDLHLPGDGTATSKSKVTFTDLSMSEPGGGYIQRNLKLPVGLDEAIALLRGADGSLGVPVSTTFNVDGSDPLGSVMQAVPEAFTAVVGKAITDSLAKAVQSVGSIVGTDKLFNFGGNKNLADYQPIALPFEPGSTSTPGLASGVGTMIERMRKDKSMTVTISTGLGSGDVSIAEQRANPSPADCVSLQEQLRARKSQLLAIRAEVLGQARGQSGTGYGSAASASVQRLRAIDRELAGIEDSLDGLYEILRPGADRQAARRTRSACLEIARARSTTVQQMLLASKLPDIQKRVTVINPTYNPTDETPGGRVTLMPVKKK